MRDPEADADIARMPVARDDEGGEVDCGRREPESLSLTRGPMSRERVTLESTADAEEEASAPQVG